MKINNFWEVGAWQESRKLTKCIYQLTGNGKFGRDFGLTRQIQRASVSVMANIAEGFGRRSDKEFVRYLDVALASNTEVQSHLFVALDLNYIHSSEWSLAFELSKCVEKAVNGFIRYLKGKT